MISLSAIGLIFSACAAKTIALDKQVKKKFYHKTITATNREGPLQPDVITPSRALGMSGMVGFLDSLALSVFDDNKSYNVRKVPSLYINNQLISALTKQYDMQYIPNQTMTKSTDVKVLIKKYPGTDYILDNQTTSWTLNYFVTHWSKYTVQLFDVMKLIDTASGKIVAQKVCSYLPEYNKHTPTYDEMFANNGRLIRLETQKALDYCVEDFKKLLFQE